MRIIRIMNSPEPKPATPADPQLRTAPGPDAGTEALDSAVLLGGRNEVEIAHQGETYRLRRTRQDKLILTK
jgi:hemin uptake protein HemP